MRAFIWDSQQKTQPLPLGGTPSSASRATGINNNGGVVGYRDIDDTMRAFRWSRQGGVVDLGTLPGDKSSKAEAINGAGQVVGSSSGPQGEHPFLWTPGAGFLDLGTLPGGSSAKPAVSTT